MQERLRDGRRPRYSGPGYTARPRRRSWVDRATDESQGVGRVNVVALLGFGILALLSLLVR
jgi:hypothetical protein